MLVLTKPKLYWTFWLYWFCKNLCYVEHFGYIDSEKTYSYVEHFGYVDSVKTYNYFKHFGHVDSEKTYVTLNILASDNSMVLRKEECWRRRVGWETHQSKYLWHVAPTSGDDAWTLVCRLLISTTGRVDNEWECCSSRRESCMPAVVLTLDPRRERKRAAAAAKGKALYLWSKLLLNPICHSQGKEKEKLKDFSERERWVKNRTCGYRVIQLSPHIQKPCCRFSTFFFFWIRVSTEE